MNKGLKIIRQLLPDYPSAKKLPNWTDIIIRMFWNQKPKKLYCHARSMGKMYGTFTKFIMLIRANQNIILIGRDYVAISLKEYERLTCKKQ